MFSLPIVDLECVQQKLEEFWPKEKVFLITGGTGFFGRWLVESIAFIEKKNNSGNKYLIITRQNKVDLISKIEVLSEPFFEIFQQDIQLPFKIDAKIDYVIHAASDVSKIKNSKESDFGSIVVATKNLLEAVHPETLKKFLYVSSGGVYSPSEAASREEDLQLVKNEVVNSYAEAKRQSELLVSKLSNSCTARCFSFVGPFVDPKMAVMDMLSKKVQKQSIVVNSPDVVRSFMYPSDLVVSLFKLLILPNLSRVYNVGSDEAVTLLDLAKKISHFETNSEVMYKESVPNTSLAGNRYFADISRIETEYGKTLTIALDEALQKTFSFMNRKGVT